MAFQTRMPSPALAIRAFRSVCGAFGGCVWLSGTLASVCWLLSLRLGVEKLSGQMNRSFEVTVAVRPGENPPHPDTVCLHGCLFQGLILTFSRQSMAASPPPLYPPCPPQSSLQIPLLVPPPTSFRPRGSPLPMTSTLLEDNRPSYSYKIRLALNLGANGTAPSALFSTFFSWRLFSWQD